MRSRLLFGCLVVLAALVLALPAVAQDMPPLPGELVIGDLGAPRGIAFDANGNLIVADAGTGGEVELTLPGPEGETGFRLGMTGRIISVAADMSASDLIAGFPSYASPSETTGLYRAIPQGDSLWVLFSGTGSSTVGAFWTDSIVEIDLASLATRRVINLNAYEQDNDPDGNGYDSNVADIAWLDDGTMLIVDAGMNSLLSWTETDGLATVATWPSNDVPTSVEVADNGDIYVGFLGAGVAPGAGKIERWSGGELAETFAGLTAVSDILWANGNLYAVELLQFSEQGPGPGDVVMVTSDGTTPVVEGLIAPFGLAMGPDGALYVSYGTIAFAPGMTGGVVKIDMGM